MATVRQRESANVRVEHFAEGSLTYIVVSGTIDEGFDPRALMSAVKTKRVVVNCAGVTRISSFGVRQWFTLMDEIERGAEQLYFVECSPKIVDQFNIVAGFAGRGKVLSFYAPYVCENCGTTRTILFRADLDQQMIRDLRPPSFTCRICEGRENFDEDPQGYFGWFARQGEIEVEEAVLSLLRGRLDYSPSSQSARPHIEKYVRGKKTFIAIRGTLDATLPTEKIVAGLEGTVVIDTSGIVFVQSSGLQAWDTLLERLLAARTVDHFYFSGIPPLALERGTLLGSEQAERFTLLSITVPFFCNSCFATSWHLVQLSSRGFRSEELPKKRCADCGAKLQALTSPSWLNKLSEMPPPRVSPGVKRFARKAPARLDAQRTRYQAKQPQGQPRTLMVAIVGGFLAMGGVSVAAFYYLSQSQSQSSQASTVPSGTGGTTVPERPDPTLNRPDWISSDQPATAYCFDTPVKSVCVGVSSFRATKAEALSEAWDTSLEELVNLLVLRAETEAIETQHSIYSKSRNQALTDVDELRKNGETQQLQKALKDLRRRRADAAESLRSTGGAGVPTQQSDSYWEEYKRVEGQGTEFLGFVRVETSNAALDALVNHYSKTRRLGGAKVVSVFPGLAWKAGEMVEGAFVLDAGKGRLKSAGAQDGDVIRSIGDLNLTGLEDFEAADEASKEAGSLELGKIGL